MTDALKLLERLIAFPTVSRDGNIDLIRHVDGLLREAGIKTRLFPDERGDRASLFASVGPATDGGVVLSGHTDVVPVDGQAWTSDPFRLVARDGALYGRGTTDMKGFVACAIEAMLAARDMDLARPLHLALSYDEEIGCVGVRPMLAELARAGIRPDWVLIGEPTLMQVAVGHKGKTNVRATCRGHAAHSALAPTGLNAIYMAADLISAIRNLQGEIETGGLCDDDYDIPYTTLHAGIIRGGTALNIVPDSCVVDFEIRNLAGDDPRVHLDRLFAEAEAIGTRHRDRFPESAIAFDIFNTYPGLDTSKQSPAASRAMALSGGSMMKVAFGTEAGLFQAHLDVPVIVCGPGSMDQGHKPDEFVTVAQLEACRAMLGRLCESLR